MSVQDTRKQFLPENYPDPHNSHQIKLETAYRQMVELKVKSDNDTFSIS